MLLKCLERVCAATAVSERSRGRAGAGSASGAAAGLSAAAGSVEAARSDGGGDDIHDYDRLDSDLAADYDWHDDGFLPRPRPRPSAADGGGLLVECITKTCRDDDTDLDEGGLFSHEDGDADDGALTLTLT